MPLQNDVVTGVSTGSTWDQILKRFSTYSPMRSFINSQGAVYQQEEQPVWELLEEWDLAHPIECVNWVLDPAEDPAENKSVETEIIPEEEYLDQIEQIIMAK